MESKKSDAPRGAKAFAVGILAGTIAALVMILVMLALRTFFGVATPMALLGDRLSAVIPAKPFLALMGKVGGYTPLKILGVSSVLAGQIVFGAIGGWIYALLRGRRAISPERAPFFSAFAFIVFPLLVSAAVLWPVLGTHYRGLPIAAATSVTLVGLLLAFVAFERTLVASYEWLLRSPSPDAGYEYSPAIGRRSVVLGAIGAAVGLSGAGLLRKLYREATFSYDGKEYRGKEVAPITPNEKFYTVTKNVVDPRVTPALWRLEIGGMVQERRSYTLAEIKAMPAVTQETTLMCISNQIGAGLMSNAQWRGVPMRDLLGPARPDAAGKKVLLHGVDNYTDSFPLEKAMNPTTLIVYEMNGEPLPDHHGAPARVIVPGYFGEKHVKWITRIEVTDDQAKGFYEKQGWGPDFTVPVRSRIDVPGDQEKLEFSKLTSGVPIKGVAFAGDRGVTRVEVSTDDGKQWQDARIDYPGTKLTWVLWSFDWRPTEPGDHRVTVRATNGDGVVEAKDEKRPFTSGVTGLHKVNVHLA